MQAFNDIILWLRLHSVIGMIGVFTLIVVATYWPGRRASIERNGSIPMRDDF
jgi:cbb3-type cytochrome oxidase subunit 3